MRAMVLNEYGDNAEFQLAELSRHSVKPGQVLVRIAATSVNTVDTMIRQMGKELPLSPQPPAVLGMDFAGIVEAAGEGVTEYAEGDEVYGCAVGLLDLQGTLAEYMIADARLIMHKPKNLSMREAAALPLVGITAYEGLKRAGVAGGDIRIGADILTRAALSDELESASGKYFDNDSGRFASPHPDALDADKSAQIVRAIETVRADLTPSRE